MLFSILNYIDLLIQSFIWFSEIGSYIAKLTTNSLLPELFMNTNGSLLGH